MGKEIIKWRRGIEKLSIEMDKLENVGIVNFGWGEIHRPTKDMNSIVPEIVP